MASIRVSFSIPEEDRPRLDRLVEVFTQGNYIEFPLGWPARRLCGTHAPAGV